MVTKTLSKSEIKEFNDKLLNLYGREFFSKKDFMQIQDNPINHLRLNKEPIFFFVDDKLIPSLKLLLKNKFLKQITVDMGAVKFICNGADVMRPGITTIDSDIDRGEIVVVIDERNKTPLVVGESLYSTQELNELRDGRVIKNLHFIGDDKWNLN